MLDPNSHSKSFIFFVIAICFLSSPGYTGIKDFNVSIIKTGHEEKGTFIEEPEQTLATAVNNKTAPVAMFENCDTYELSIENRTGFPAIAIADFGDGIFTVAALPSDRPFPIKHSHGNNNRLMVINKEEA